MGMSNKEVQEAMKAHQSGQSNEPISKPAHSLSFEDVLKELGGSGLAGLSDSDAEKRLADYGTNELDNGPGVNPAKILVRQIATAMMLVSPTCPKEPGGHKARWSIVPNMDARGFTRSAKHTISTNTSILDSELTVGK